MGRGTSTNEASVTPRSCSRLEQALTLARAADQRGGFLTGLETIIRDLGQKYGEPTLGSSRVVFNAGDSVIKVPYNDEGLIANSREANWKSTEIPLAHCEFFHRDEADRIYLLRMEKVIPLTGQLPRDQRPEWSDFVDGGQIGRTADGKLVAFDL